MDLGNAIRTLRKKKKLRLSDVDIGKTLQTLSRIESGKIILNHNTLNQIINELDIEPVEFFTYANKLDYSENFILQLRKASASPDDLILKSHLIKTYLKEEYQFSEHSKEISQYYAIKNHFKDKWNLGDISSSDMLYVSKHLRKQSFHGFYEYFLLFNTIIHLANEDARQVFTQMYPIEQENMRDSETKKYAFSAVLNIISKRIYDGHYEEAMYYLEQSKNIDAEKSDYYFKLSIRYLENLCLFLTTHDSEHYGKLLNYISVLRDLGDDTTADLLKEEIEELAFGDPKNIKDSLIKDR
ncbi:hypothetical protein [uncultured Enterococcus sp.]|uniref:helix-turn-helix domain-containing protein n=1 Tax=uncultured Enterococcus sp. TaxID=167972 RepID=UPI002AA75ADF|nr:hypothetical protein [uncultured Enterococcus sp.]